MAAGDRRNSSATEVSLLFSGRTRRPRVLETIVEETRQLATSTATTTRPRLLRIASSVLSFSLPQPSPPARAYSYSKFLSPNTLSLTATKQTATTKSITTQTSPSGKPGRRILGREAAAAAREQGIVPMHGTASKPASAVKPGPTPPKSTSTTTSDLSVPNTSSKSSSILKTRKSASQLAQRLSPWSSSSTSSEKHGPKLRNVSSCGNLPSSSTNKSASAAASSSDSLSPTNREAQQRASFLRRLSPGLAARVKLLDSSNKAAPPPPPRARNPIGKIPEKHLQELDRLHRDLSLSIKVQKKGRAWSRGDERKQKQQQQYSSSPPDAATRRPAHAGRGIASRAVEAAPTSSAPEESSTASTNHAVVENMATGAGTMTHGTAEQTDFEKYLKTSTLAAEEGTLPIPPPKDYSPPPTASGSSNNNNNNNNASNSSNGESYFNPLGLRRTDSIYSFSRVSFSNQLSQLTSIPLPQPSSLEATISSIGTAPAAVRALTGAAEQIEKWINKASDVLSGLDAEDDVEWAAAGGREGLDEVDKSVSKFECLINVYVQAIENVQLREDIAQVGAEQLQTVVEEMETTLQNWRGVRGQLTHVKEQVELAMEWEELWNQVLGDVGMEIDNLSRLIFEMEEKRHRPLAISEPEPESSNGLDINELETIIEESPAPGLKQSTARLTMAPVFPPANASYLDLRTSSQSPHDESSLLALIARMQPLRASLDFLPMRLAMFQSRADTIFPSACEELEERRHKLEKGYKKLETDAEALRRELGEDRWVIVFRNAGKQAHKMCESVERSVSKLQEAIDGGIQHNNPAALAKRAENFEAKKVHYGSAIERVLLIIHKGIKDRLTVNGEVIRLHADLRARFEALRDQMRAMDSLLDELSASRSQQLRDSISSIVTIDSPANRSAIDTPESSPASSVVMSGGNGIPNIPSRRSSASGSTVSRATASKMKRYSGLPQPLGPTPRRSSFNRASTNPGHLMSPSTPRLSTTSPSPTPTPRASSRMSASSKRVDNRPPWNGSANTNGLDVGHNFKPLSLTTPSPHQRPGTRTGSRMTNRSLSSSLPVRSPLSRESSASPAPGLRVASRLHIHRGVTSSPMPHRDVTSPTPQRASIIDPPPYSKLRKQGGQSAIAIPTSSSTARSSAPRNRQSFGGSSSVRLNEGSENKNGTTAKGTARPGTALGHSGNRRSSLLPVPKPKSGKESSLGNRPPWRG